jgi:hypothetical protein
MTMPWFRLYGETVDDSKLRLLAFEDRWHYVAILCCKSQGIQDTTMPELLDRMMSVKLGLAERERDEAKRRLVEVGLIDSVWQPIAWDRRQFQSDTSRERTRKWRDRQNSPSPPLRTESDSEQNRTERDVTCDVTVTSPIASLRKSASRIPDDFALTDERKAYAEKHLPRVDAPALLESFLDHWKAASGPKARKLDWDATWRTWVRNANQFGYPMVAGVTRVAAPQIRIDANGREIRG